MKNIPKSLRTWFIIHFAVDFIFAIPMLFFTRFTLALMGFPTENLMFARLIGAALIGIGGVSFTVRDETKETFNALLTLKLLWSSAAVVGILISIIEGAPKASWLLLAIFAVFFFIWLHYKKKIK